MNATPRTSTEIAHEMHQIEQAADENLGDAAVDSGQLMLVDPCYLPEHLVRSLTRPRRPLAVMFSTGYGDGTFPVRRTAQGVAGESGDSASGDAPTSAPEAPGSDSPEAGKLSREAAKYRRRMRDAEATAESLGKRLAGMQRREVERLVGEQLSTPDDFWLAGPELAELLTEDGDLDTEKVNTAVAEVLAARPGWSRPPPPPNSDGGARRSAPVAATMADVLRGGRRR